MADAPREASYWSQDVSVLAAALGAGLEGLTSVRAAAQLAAVPLHTSIHVARYTVYRSP